MNSMAKRNRKQREKLAAPTSEYRDADGNVLTLRGSLTAGSRRRYADTLAGGLEREDAWQRATELLFEFLAVSWTISGLEITRQKELLGRYRMATRRRAAVRPRRTARARHRALPGAPGAVIDADAFATLLCDWCLDVRERDYVLVSTTTLAAPLVRALHRALITRGRVGAGAAHRAARARRGLLPPRVRRSARQLRAAGPGRNGADRRVPAHRRAREHPRAGGGRSGDARPRRPRAVADPGGPAGQAMVRHASGPRRRSPRRPG